MTRTASSLGGPAGSSRARGNSSAGPVLHRAEQPAVVVVVDRPPRAPRVLGVADPLALVGTAPVPRLPPDALVAHGRRRLDRRSGQPGDPRRHASSPTASTTTSTAAGSTSAMLRRYSRTRCLDEPADLRDRRPPLRDEVQLDAHRAVLARDAHRVLPRQRTISEPSHSVDFPRRVRGVTGEDLGRDRRLTGHQCRLAPPRARAPSPPGAPRSGTGRTSCRARPRRASSRRRSGRRRSCTGRSDARSGPSRPGSGSAI